MPEFDCADADPLSTTLAADADCDGALTLDDCDDADPNVRAIANDADCDGVQTTVDCDDADAGMPSGDGDCDGTSTALDCDDANPLSFTTAQDGDCDGIPTAADCDDADVLSYPIAQDADCDGIPTALDCDDNNPLSYPIAQDADCDDVPSTMDCDDADSSNTKLFIDAEPDSPTSPESIALDSPTAGNLCGGDRSDHWRATPAPVAGCAVTTTITASVGASTVKVRSGSELVASTPPLAVATVRSIATSLPTDVEIQGAGEVNYSLQMTRSCAAVTPSCPTDDPYEPNHALSTAVFAPYGSTFAAAVCGPFGEVYRFTARPGCTGRFTLNFTHSLGDLDLFVYDVSSVELGKSEGATNTETVSTVLSSDVYVIVTGYDGDHGSYTLAGSYTCP